MMVVVFNGRPRVWSEGVAWGFRWRLRKIRGRRGPGFSLRWLPLSALGPLAKAGKASGWTTFIESHTTQKEVQISS